MKPRLDYEPLFSILDGMGQDADRRFWIERVEASEDNCAIEEDLGQVPPHSCYKHFGLTQQFLDIITQPPHRSAIEIIVNYPVQVLRWLYSLRSNA